MSRSFATFVTAMKYCSIVLTVIAITSLSYTHMVAAIGAPIPNGAYLVLLAVGVTGVLAGFIFERHLAGDGTPT